VAIATSAAPFRPDCINNTTSAENVENVVSPPQKPVVMNKRHSGAKAGYWAKNASAIPMI
jgi:hypothetical protein